MVAPIVGSAFDAAGFYEHLAKFASAIAVWASMRAERAQPIPEQALEDLTLRLRRPWRYRAQRVTRLFTRQH